MTHVVADRVRETSITTGTGTLTLAGAVVGFRTMASVLTVDTDTGWFVVTDGVNWEVFLGTRVSANTLARTTIYASSNGGAAVNWGVGTRDVFGNIPARFAEILNTVELVLVAASTVDIGALNGLKILISGMTTITSLGAGSHKLRFVRFDNILTLTHNATSLILPGAANITTAAGDTAVFASDGPGNWRCWSYQRADGTPVVVGGVTSLNGQTGALKSLTPPQGRLTLQTAVPVMVTTQSAKTTIYYTPYVGDKIPIYNGTNMVPTTFTEISVLTTDTTKNPAAIGASKVNDWFVWNDSGTLRLSHGPDWTNDTTRSAGTALTMVNGILLNNASITNGPAASRGTYVGTTRSNGSSQLDWIYGALAAGGTAGFFGVWNAYNRRRVFSLTEDNTDSWTYATGSWRSSNGSATMRASFVSGLAEDAFNARFYCPMSGSNGGAVGIGYDATNAFSGVTGEANNAFFSEEIGEYGTTALGFHFFQAIEYAVSAATVTFYGDAGDAYHQNGLLFEGWM